MSRDYKRTLFDELALVAVIGKRRVLVWYDGPRRDQFIKSFGHHTSALDKEARSRFFGTHEPGDFEFTHEGEGSQSEAFLVLGPGLYLLCGNTRLTMSELAENPLWLVAQKHFVDMSERFRVHPLQLSSAPMGTELPGW